MMFKVEWEAGEIDGAIDLWKQKVETALETYLTEGRSDLQTMVNENNERVWATQGTNIGGNWEGNTLVATGALKGSLVNASLMIVGDSIVWSSDLDYAEFVDQKFKIYGADDKLLMDIAEGFVQWFDSWF